MAAESACAMQDAASTSAGLVRAIDDVRAEVDVSARIADRGSDAATGAVAAATALSVHATAIESILGLNLDAEPDDVWYRAEAVKHLEFVLFEHVNGRIEPARRTLLTRFAIAERHVGPIVVNSPFVPAGRVAIMAIGIVRMIQGNYLTASPLLYPQLENILQNILVTHGDDPSKI